MTKDASRYSDSMERAHRSVMTSDRFSSLRGQPQRRVLVVCVAAALIVYAASPGIPATWVPLASLVVYLTAALLIRVVTRGVGDMPDEALDERQRQVRNSSYLEAYRIVGGLVALAVLRFILFRGEGGRVALDDVVYLLTAILFAMLAAPSCVVAWKERDDA